MKIKRSLELVFYTLVLFHFLSCRNEILAHEDYKVKKEIIARQMSFEELQKVPNLNSKLETFKISKKIM